MTFRTQQDRIEYYNSDEFKQAERERIERSQVKEHIDRGNRMVWCPDCHKTRPEWLCAYEHGDFDPQFDIDLESND